MNEHFPTLAPQEYGVLSAGTPIMEKNLSYSMWYQGVLGLCYCRVDWDAYVEGTVRKWEVLAAHGAAGVLGVEAAEGYVEARAAGVQTLRLTFDEALDTATVGPAAIGIVGQTHGDCSSLVSAASLDGSGKVLTVQLRSKLEDGDRYTVTVADSVRTVGGRALAGNRTRQIGALAGDVNRSGQVTAGDLLAVRARVGQAVTASNAGYDVDGSGTVSGSDILLVRHFLGDSLP